MMTDVSIYREAEQLLNLYRKHANCPAQPVLQNYSDRAVSLLFDYYQVTQQSLRPAIDLICEISSLDNREASAIGTHALFIDLIEKLSDSFNPDYCELYDTIFAQVISFFRKLPIGFSLHQRLNHLGIHREEDLLHRKRSITQPITPQSPRPSIQKIILLSRVTIGADIAITSVFISCLSKLYPNAELVLIGSSKLEQLFGGIKQLRVRSINYQRGGSIIDRLQSWLEVQSTIESETQTLSPDLFYIIDPDSRLTQLGLLPLLPISVELKTYQFFPSRIFQSVTNFPIGKLASLWISDLMNINDDFYPTISSPNKIKQSGFVLSQKLRSLGATKLTCISLGVGGNNQKRLSGDFESKLIENLMMDSTVILDSGTTPDEIEQIQELLSSIQLSPTFKSTFYESNPDSIDQLTVIPNLISVNGGIGFLSSIIANSDHYIGYDSAGQHIAAAQQVPSTTIFVNSASNKFTARWYPYGTGFINVIDTQRYQELSHNNFVNEVLREVLMQNKQILSYH